MKLFAKFCVVAAGGSDDKDAPDPQVDEGRVPLKLTVAQYRALQATARGDVYRTHGSVVYTLTGPCSSACLWALACAELIANPPEARGHGRHRMVLTPSGCAALKLADQYSSRRSSAAARPAHSLSNHGEDEFRAPAQISVGCAGTARSADNLKGAGIDRRASKLDHNLSGNSSAIRATHAKTCRADASAIVSGNAGLRSRI